MRLLGRYIFKFELKFTMERYSSFNKFKGRIDTLDNHVQKHIFLKKKIFIKRKTKMLRHSHMTQEGVGKDCK